MSFGRYLKSGVWEVLLCTVAASALSYTACSAFYASLALQDQLIVIIAGCAVICASLFFVAYNMRAAIMGGIAITVVLAAVFCFLASQAPGMPLEDMEGNDALAFAMVALPAVTVFLLSRKKGTTVVLIIGGVYLCAIMEYLYWRGLMVALLVFLMFSSALLVYKSYQINLKQTDAGWVRFSPVAIMALLCAAAALAIGWCVWNSIIEPLNPPSEQVKLIVEYRKAPEIEEHNTGGATEEGSTRGGDLAGGDEVESDETAAGSPLETMQGTVLEFLGFSDMNQGDEGETAQLFPPSLILLLYLLALLLVIAAILFAVHLKRRVRFNRLTNGTPRQAAQKLYRHFLKSFKKLKIVRPDTVSLSVFAREQAHLFEGFEGFGSDTAYESDYACDYENSPDDDFDFAMAAEARAEKERKEREALREAGNLSLNQSESRTFSSSFEVLTDSYTCIVYGNEEPSEEDLERFKDYYWEFFHNARMYLGRFRYIPKFFSL